MAYLSIMCNAEHDFISHRCYTLTCFDFLHQLKQALAVGCTLCGILMITTRVVYSMYTLQSDYTCITVRKSIDRVGNCN